MATLAESFMADLADLSDDSASDNEQQPQTEQRIDGKDLLVTLPSISDGGRQLFQAPLSEARSGAKFSFCAAI
jgi:hypothetical protein